MMFILYLSNCIGRLLGISIINLLHKVAIVAGCQLTTFMLDVNISHIIMLVCCQTDGVTKSLCSSEKLRKL